MKFRRLASTLVLWVTVAAGIAIVAAAHAWWPAIVRHAAGTGDPRPGARRQPTPAELEAARKNWMRRKVGSEMDGPSPLQVIEAVGRRGYPSPPDAAEW